MTALFSDTLFGHKKGAFTGADQAREGMIARAAGGTLFLDEIGDLNESSQIKLLRLLQGMEYYPVGSDIARKSDARVVLATNRDLQQLIAAGKFRNDLYLPGMRPPGHHSPAARTNGRYPTAARSLSRCRGNDLQQEKADLSARTRHPSYSLLIFREMSGNWRQWCLMPWPGIPLESFPWRVSEW